MATEQLRVLVSKQEDMYVAQCLEHDICVQADDMKTLQCRFEATVEQEAASQGLDAIPPAPQEFHDIWAKAQELESRIENAEMRLAA